MTKLIYVNGHFYDSETKQRITIMDDTEVIIPNEKNTSKAEKVGGHHDIRDSKKQEAKIKNDFNVIKYKKVLEVGAKLYFWINLSNINHVFEVELLEDLYFYLKKDGKKNDSRLYDCACVVRQNTSKTIKMFEEIFGKSLNQVYKNTYVHFFGNHGAPSCNAIDRFYEDMGAVDKSINVYRIIDKKE